MAETVIIKVVATDTEGATGEARATITVDSPDAPDIMLPRITRLFADDTTLDPSQITNITVEGENYDRAIWDSPVPLEEHADGVKKQIFTAQTNVRAGTTYTVTVTLANDHGSDSRSIILTINNVAPIISNLTGIPQIQLSESVTVGEGFTAVATASDANGDDIGFFWDAPGFTQNVGMANNERDFTAPDSILGESDAIRTIVCTADDIPPSPYRVMSDSRQQDLIVAPGKPSAPDITMHGTTQTSIEFEWSQPTDNGGSPITGYRVWIRVDDSANFTRAVRRDSSTLIYEYEDLAAETPYEVAVEAFNTFDINGISYGQTSDRGTLSVITDPIRVIPAPEDPNVAPFLNPLPNSAALGVTAEVSPNEQTITLVAEYGDMDGDEVHIVWDLDFSSLPNIATFDWDVDVNPFEGMTRGYLTVPALVTGFSIIKTIATDGRDDTLTTEIQWIVSVES